MKKRFLIILSLIAIIASSCQKVQIQAPDGTKKVSGDFSYSNGFVLETYYVEHAVALVDLHGFITRDKEWPIPVQGQVLGYMKLDQANKKGTYMVSLPALPEATFNDLSRAAIKMAGVQVFCVGYWGNLVGGPYADGDDETRGWPTYMTSIVIDTENKDEITGGKLVVWSPDDAQKFPTGFGPDKLLFTADDPLGSIPAGYSVVDLDKTTFKVSRATEEKLTLFEPQDIAIKDFSADSFSSAFDKMFNQVRKEYAFNGIGGKQPDWDKVYAKVSPLVKQAEEKNDAMAYYEALKTFISAFKDGHVSIDGGDLSSRDYQENVMGGVGVAIRELDEGKVIVTKVMQGGPAALAGVQAGAEILKYNGLPIGKAIDQVVPITGPSSTDFGYRYDQVRFLLRQPVGNQVTLTYVNEGSGEQTVTLTTMEERDSLIASSLFSGYDPNALPVEFRILDQGIGYVRINSNYDDLNLVIRLFMRALSTFKQNEIPALIIDMRTNTGGSPLGLAGFLYNKEISLGQLEYFSDKSNTFEPNGPREKIIPNLEQFDFSRKALLVGQACYSACEIEAYGFSQVPDMIVVGETPSGGTEAEVSRGSFKLPADISVQIPTGRFTAQDGSIFLEGTGVQPTLKVPVTKETLLGSGDAVLDAAIKAVTE